MESKKKSSQLQKNHCKLIGGRNGEYDSNSSTKIGNHAYFPSFVFCSDLHKEMQYSILFSCMLPSVIPSKIKHKWIHVSSFKNEIPEKLKNSFKDYIVFLA